MRQGPNPKRGRGRGNGGRNRPQNPRSQTFDSNGPSGRIRGNAHQVFEKYLALARDAQTSGDRVMAENFFQHAEHYFRIMVAAEEAQTRNGGPVRRYRFDDQTGEGGFVDAGEGDGNSDGGQQPPYEHESEAEQSAA